MRVTSFDQVVAATWSPAEPFPRIPQWTVDRVYGCLRVVDALLSELDIPYFAICGTLLGAVRHGGLIPWDVDGDVGIRRDDVPRVLRESRRFLAERGFGLGRELRFALLKVFPLDGYKIRPWHRFRFPYVDIFPMVERSTGRWTHAPLVTRLRWPGEYFDHASFTTLQRYQFGPLELTAPPTEIAHHYLTSSYGPTWRSEAYFDPYRVPALRRVPPIAINEFPPALPSARQVEEWEQGVW